MFDFKYPAVSYLSRNSRNMDNSPLFSNFVKLLFILTFWEAFAGNTPPKILFQSAEKTLYFKEQHQVELPCIAFGTPAPSYRWTFNGVDFDPSGNDGRVEIKAGLGNLVFHSTLDKDEGQYQCYANNGVGTAVSDIVNLRRAFIKNNSGQDPTEVHQVYLDFPLTLRCPVPISQPFATVHWEMKHTDGSSQLVKLSNRVNRNLEGNLQFTNVIQADSQNGSIYFCVSTNPVTQHKVQSSGHKIIVHGTTQHLFPASVMWSSPPWQLALTGDNITLKCIFSGNPTPTVYWARDNFTSLPSKAIQRSWGQELLIPNADQSDAGIYECIGVNSETDVPVIHRVNLLLQSKPDWTHPPRDIEALPSETVTINCTAHASPAPRYRWYINGVEITNLNVSHIINNVVLQASEPSILTINNVTVLDQMNIQCNATNIHGYIFADIALNVRDTVAVQSFNNATSSPLCNDRLGTECVKVKAAGYCHDVRVSRFCRHSCGKCASPSIIG